MTINCKICSGSFGDSQDSIILCDLKEGVVHLGCCINKLQYE